MTGNRQINSCVRAASRARIRRLVAAVGIMAFVLLAMVGKTFCQTNSAKIFRLIFSEKMVSNSAEMFSTRTNLSSRKAILSHLTNAPTRLTDRDVIIMYIEHHGERAEPVTLFRWSLASACKATGAQLYDFDCSGVVTNRAAGIREMSVLHWKAPYEEPRNMEKTEFYLDEKIMGIGEAGLKEAIGQLAARKPHYLAMAGSRYTMDRSYGFSETPFGKLEKEVYDGLKRNGITEVVLCDEYVWAASGNDFYEGENHATSNSYAHPRP